jgi:hypothetical protein
MKSNKKNIVLCLTAVLCVGSIPVIEYVGGRLCFPLIVPPLLPAQIVPYALWLFAVVMLLIAIIRSLKKRNQLILPCASLLIAIASMWFFLANYEPLSGFLLGMKTRFVNKVGYPKMREFAKEIALEYEKFAEDPNSREDLSSRYPFLNWAFGKGNFYMGDDVVEHTWGSPLTGHWGFQVSPDGAVKDIERGKFLRVSKDIQFVYYKY